ncbi:hypothetical protein KALB_418 [Kutzneria albida DSM 43870]|uniref:Uncharacterized protein n=1 Tax=Kutzneria albida DSM 43870 TaxID=1449976 RepID=W5VZA4_9PSEU|nr:hypothetical protein KALB_418 [Kutzneria albida DSM 43870]
MHAGQIYLQDGTPGLPDWDRCFTANPVGIIGVYGGDAILLTGLHTGHVGFRVVVAEADPGPELAAYEDVVEIDFSPATATVALVEWAGEDAHPLGELPAGPGNYRLRYHARGMDAGHELDTAEEHDEDPVDDYLLQVWPAPPSAPGILQVRSEQARRRLER